jgi:hypothetical protein
MYDTNGDPVEYSDGRRIYDINGKRIIHNGGKTVVDIDSDGDESVNSKGSKGELKPLQNTEENLRQYLGNLQDVGQMMKAATDAIAKPNQITTGNKPVTIPVDVSVPVAANVLANQVPTTTADAKPVVQITLIDRIIKNSSNLEKAFQSKSGDKTWVIVMENGEVKSGNLKKMKTALNKVGVTDEITLGLKDVKKFEKHELGQAYHISKSMLTRALNITETKLNDMAKTDKWDDEMAVRLMMLDFPDVPDKDPDGKVVQKADEEKTRVAKQKADEEKVRVAKQKADEEKVRVAKQKADEEKQKADEEKVRVAKQKADEEKQKADEEKVRVAKQKADEEKVRVAKQKADEEKQKADEANKKVDEANKKAKKKEDGYEETDLTSENLKGQQILKNLTYGSDGKPLKDGTGVEQFGKYLVSNHKKRTYIIQQKIKNGWSLLVNKASHFHTYAEVTKATGHNDNTVFNHIGHGIRHDDYRISLWSKDLKFDDASYRDVHKKVIGW